MGGCAVADPVDSGSDRPAESLLLLEQLGPPVLSALDPRTGAKETRYTVASGGFAYDLDAGAAGVTLSYTAPATDGGTGYDRSGLVRLGADDALSPVACPDAAGVWCFFPVNAPDSDRVWFVEVADGLPGGAEHALAYVDAPGGEVHAVVPWATEPAISPDGSQIAWIAVDPDTKARSLVLGDAEGTALRTLIPMGIVSDLSQPFFSPDGASVYVVVPSLQVASAWSPERLLMGRAEAHGNHDVVGDWWRVPAEGGSVSRVTDLNTVQYDGRAHPDGRWFAAATREGVSLIDLETGEATTLLEIRTVRALDWAVGP